MQIYLPFEKWLAVASFNNHLDTMIKSYNIKSTDKNYTPVVLVLVMKVFIWNFFTKRNKWIMENNY